MAVVTRDRRSSGLTADDWTRAALHAIAAGGLSAVSVERLAVTLGATKGSFYWHFPDRSALIVAALDRWEQRDTDEVIASLDTIDDPRDRLIALLRQVFAEDSRAVLDVMLLADADDPVVGPVLERVARKRLVFVEGLFRRLHASNPKARALMAFSAFVGFTQLRRTSRDLVPQGPALQRYVRSLTDQLLME